ncbi:MAG: hypothetical protein PW734_08720 [Verrucomicrobium sp.]|nr:hypothetical protein [Verrucomicrobium sp.]
MATAPSTRDQMTGESNEIWAFIDAINKTMTSYNTRSGQSIWSADQREEGKRLVASLEQTAGLYRGFTHNRTATDKQNVQFVSENINGSFNKDGSPTKDHSFWQTVKENYISHTGNQDPGARLASLNHDEQINQPGMTTSGTHQNHTNADHKHVAHPAQVETHAAVQAPAPSLSAQARAAATAAANVGPAPELPAVGSIQMGGNQMPNLAPTPLPTVTLAPQGQTQAAQQQQQSPEAAAAQGGVAAAPEHVLTAKERRQQLKDQIAEQKLENKLEAQQDKGAVKHAKAQATINNYEQGGDGHLQSQNGQEQGGHAKLKGVMGFLIGGAVTYAAIRNGGAMIGGPSVYHGRGYGYGGDPVYAAQRDERLREQIIYAERQRGAAMAYNPGRGHEAHR